MKISLKFLSALFLSTLIILVSNLNAKSPERKIISAKINNKTVHVLSNTIYVRFKAGFDLKNNLEEFLMKSGVVVEHKLLEDRSSLTNNKSKHAFIQSDIKRVNEILKAEEPLLRTYRFVYEGVERPFAFCKRLMENYPEIEIAEPCYADKILYVPNDPLASFQEMLETIKAFDAWDIYKGDSSIVIGISDNGCLQEHEDIHDNIARNWAEIPDNNIDDDNNGYIDDYEGYNFAHPDDNTPWGYTYHPFGHGTNVSGVAAADFDNSTGMTGVAGKCRLFPIKTSPTNESQYLVYTYESIIYAAIRKFKVLNCSWGSPKAYSEVDQSVIDFAVANDVAIVAAAGNSSGDIIPYYPAGYSGVLGVGEVNQFDGISATSALGAHVDIMAPGGGNTYTTNDGDYSNSGFSGTSAAAPVVSGLVALIRGKHPNLSAYQSLAFAKLCVDDISDKNFGWEKIVRGRVNLLKAVSDEPLAKPSIEILKMNYFDNDGSVKNRFNAGDTVIVRVDAYNYLGEADNLGFILSTALDYTESVTVIDSSIEMDHVDLNSPVNIGDFKIVINNPTTDLMFFRLDIYIDGDFHQFQLYPFRSSNEVTDFQNSRIIFSAGDRGTIGFGGTEDDRQGIGFVLRGRESALYSAGLIIVDGMNRVSSALHGEGQDNNDFVSTKPYSGENHNTSKVADIYNLFEATQTISLPEDEPYARISVEIKNISGFSMTDVSAGYFFDWDVGSDADNNIVRPIPFIIPDSSNYTLAGEYITVSESDSALFGCSAYSEKPEFEAQAAGLNKTITSGFDDIDIIRSLTSGISWQNEETSDVSMIVGMKMGDLATDESKTFTFCFGAGSDEKEITEKFRECSGLTVGVDDILKPENFSLQLYPVPANEMLNISVTAPDKGLLKIKLIDLGGSVIAGFSRLFNGNAIYSRMLDIKDLAPGAYWVIAELNGKKVSKKIIKTD